MSTDSEQLPEVKIRIPGPQNFTPEQRDAVRELKAGIESEGFEASWPIRKTASTAQGILDAIGLYLADQVSGKVLNISVGKLLDIGIDWAKAQFKKHPRQEDEPPRTTTVIIYGPDDQPLKEVEVVEDDGDDSKPDSK